MITGLTPVGSSVHMELSKRELKIFPRGVTSNHRMVVTAVKGLNLTDVKV